MSSTRTHHLLAFAATTAALLALTSLGACGIGEDPPAQDIGQVQPHDPTPAEGFDDEPSVGRGTR